ARVHSASRTRPASNARKRARRSALSGRAAGRATTTRKTNVPVRSVALANWSQRTTTASTVEPVRSPGSLGGPEREREVALRAVPVDGENAPGDLVEARRQRQQAGLEETVILRRHAAIPLVHAVPARVDDATRAERRLQVTVEPDGHASRGRPDDRADP